METFNRIILSITQIDGIVWLFGGIGVIFIFLGGILVNINPPNYQIGYPTTAIGFACFVFAVSIGNSKKSEKKMDQILDKLKEIQEELKNNNDPDSGLKSDSEKLGE
ncbi:MAG: hypothetical protein CVV32_00425 [Methanomicrobiales archaeon HGW-Methanomicrobiales-3]|jgi:hypothetical protein|nr:MAG: hypothetical protein CVV32_00425 [Methanomicrobiales archaeon HGW-Methanomicrobiales-3]